MPTNNHSTAEVQVQALGAQSAMMTIFSVLAFVAVAWAMQAPVFWLRWAITSGILSGALTYVLLLLHSRGLIGDEESVIEIEPEEESEREPILVSAYGDRRREERNGGRMARFVADSRESSNQRALRSRGWSEIEIVSRRDRLIEQKQAAWNNPDDHKAGWKLL